MMTSGKERPKEYYIHTINDVCNAVTGENIERFIADINAWLRDYVKIMAEVREKGKGEFNNMKNSDIAEAGFIWQDDGVTGVDMSAVKIYLKKYEKAGR